MGKYEQAYAEFTAKYDLNLNIQKEYNGANSISSIDDFAMDTSPEIKAQNVYISTLSSALTDYIIKKVKIEPGKSYDLANIDIGGFITEFDKVIDAIRSDEAEKEKTEYTHRKFEGLPLDRVANEAWARVAPRYNKPLHEIWAGQIRRGTLPLEQLQRITNSSTKVLDEMVGPVGYNSASNKDLADVVMIKNAMAEAINKRSWTSWLNPFNWGPNMRENSYLKELNEKINTYRENNFPVDDVVPAIYTGNMLEGALSELQKAYGAKNTAQKPAATAKQEKNVKAEKKKPEPNKKKQSAKKKDVVGKVPTQEVAEELMNNDAFSERIFNVIGNYGDEFMRNVTKSSNILAVRTRIDNAWNDFKNADTEDEKKEAVQDIAIKTFKTFYNTLVANISSYSNSAVDQIVMTQKLTDFVLNNFSPIASNSKYAEYGNNYYVKNATPKEFLDNALLGSRYYGRSVEDAKNDLANAKFELGVGKMSVNTDKDFKEKPTQKSDKISNLDDPKKTISKDK